MHLNRKKAIYYSIIKWKYLSQLSHMMISTKSNLVLSRYPIFKYFPSYSSMCKKYENDNWRPGMMDNRCEKCPLYIKWGFNCYYDKSPVNEWNKNKTKINADIIVEELESIRNPIKFWWNYRFKRFKKIGIMKKLHRTPTSEEVIQICSNINDEIKDLLPDDYWWVLLQMSCDGANYGITFLSDLFWTTEDEGDWNYDYDKDLYPEDFETFIKRMVMKHISYISNINFL